MYQTYQCHLYLTDPPADIVEHPQNYSSFLSLSATFHCNGSSSFPVTYSWRRVNSSLNITDQATGHNSSTLVILRTQHSDEGWYQCVTSVFGVESFSDPAYLVVKGMLIPYMVVCSMTLWLSVSVY